MATKKINSETLEQDMAIQNIEIPPLLEEAFKYEKSAKIIFEALPISHRNEHIKFITEAKKYETRRRRVIRVINLLYEGKKSK